MKEVVLFISCLFFSLSLIAQPAIKRDSPAKNISQSLKADTATVPSVNLPITFNQNALFKFRLDSIQQIIPLSYNKYVQEYIDIYSNRKSDFSRILGLGKYYFPIFEKALAEYGIPEEIKYLPVIESKINPYAVSRFGATGIWQFMFGTGKAYGLNIDNFVDERKDPIQASYAAAAYFKDAYEELGDWLLAIAAYNCGKTNVKRAIAKAGSSDFWKIRPFLPKETRNYVPAYIAAVYVMNYALKHDIVSQPSPFPFKTDTIQVNKYVLLSDLATATHYQESVLANLNPSFKKKIINGTQEDGKRLVLPVIQPTDYQAVYEILNAEASVERKIILASIGDVRKLRRKEWKNAKSSFKCIFHKVLPGQVLNLIAKKYRVEAQDIKVWNHLPNFTIIPGQKLKIYIAYRNPKLGAKPKATFFTYKIKAGDTLSEIAKKFAGATVSGIKKTNGLTKAALKPGMVLKINKS